MAGLKILLTANAAWNVGHFRRPLVAALLAERHAVTVLAPADDAVPALREMGCRFVPLAMDAKGLNPLEGLRLHRAFTKAYRAEQPDIVFGSTIKNNLFGAMAARRGR